MSSVYKRLIVIHVFSGGECIFCFLDEVGVGIDVNYVSRHVWW